MDRLSADEVGVALDKRIVPHLRGEVWPVCTGGYRIEGFRKNRHLVPAYPIDLLYDLLDDPQVDPQDDPEAKWRTINLAEERSLIPDFVSAYRRAQERTKPGGSEVRELEGPILDFTKTYGIGISGTFRWAGGPGESIATYAVIMGVVAPVVDLLGALLDNEKPAIEDALEACPHIEDLELAAGGPASWLGGDEEFYTDIRERALARVSYIVARSFHKLCLPFAIPQPGARRLDQMDTGLGFSSLGGAMFWQLYQVIFAQGKIRRCDYCNTLIIGAREGTRFCNASCRNKNDNHSGRRAERDQGKGARN